MKVQCPYCQRAAKLVHGRDIYPHRPDLAAKPFWHCEPCQAWVGCHPRHKRWSPNGITPLGRLANAELRKAKQKAHAAFDPLWMSGRMKRTDAYAWLGAEIGVSGANCHIGMMDVDACVAVVAAVANRQRKAA